MRGPSGAKRLSFAGRIILGTLLRNGMASADELLASLYPAGTRQPAKPQNALRVQIMRVRTALVQVGLPGTALHNVHGLGYAMRVPFEDSRVINSSQFAALEALLSSHPDQAAVAGLALWGLGVTEVTECDT